MKLKITILFSLLVCVVLSQGIVDTTGVKSESFVTVDQQIIDVKSYLEKLNKTVYVLDSLLKANQLFTNEKLGQLEKSITKQATNLEDQIKSVYIVIEQIEGELSKSISGLDKNVNNNLSKIIIAIDSLKLNLDMKSKKLNDSIKKANTQIITLDKYIEKVNTDSKIKIDSLIKTISDSTLYWIIAIFIVFIIVIVFFFFLKSKVTEQQDSLSYVKDTQEKLQKEAIILDEKTIDLIENQLSVLKLQTQQATKVDHSLPIKLGEEIHRMRKRLKTMEESRGTQVLNKRIESLEEKLNDLGYEIVNLEGQSFNDGMTVEARFVPDENLKDGEEIINRVIKPQINFNNKLIQAAQVEVAQGV